MTGKQEKLPSGSEETVTCMHSCLPKRYHLMLSPISHSSADQAFSAETSKFSVRSRHSQAECALALSHAICWHQQLAAEGGTSSCIMLPVHSTGKHFCCSASSRLWRLTTARDGVRRRQPQSQHLRGSSPWPRSHQCTSRWTRHSLHSHLVPARTSC